jgi:hypothetical protein
MKFGEISNTNHCEYKMQEVLERWLIKKNINYIREFNVSEVNRIPDFLIKTFQNGLVNVEAKCYNYAEMICQLKDNSIYCNYSFAYIMSNALTPLVFKRALIDNKFGLIVYDELNETCVEVLEAHLNRGVDKELQKKINMEFDKKIKEKKQLIFLKTQINILYE